MAACIFSKTKTFLTNATIFRIHGPFLFGATDKISIVTENIHKLPPVVVLRLRKHDCARFHRPIALEEVAKTLKTSRAGA